MKYRYEIIKNDGVSIEKYESAFYCSFTSVESILYDYNIDISHDIPYIFIYNKDDLPFTLSECDNIIKGAFINSHKMTYDEFKIIKPKDIS